MFVLVTYDVSTVEAAGRRRLRRVARACCDYGVRAQKSVFECRIGQAEWALLRDRLLREYQSGEDLYVFIFWTRRRWKRLNTTGFRNRSI